MWEGCVVNFLFLFGSGMTFVQEGNDQFDGWLKVNMLSLPPPPPPPHPTPLFFSPFFNCCFDVAKCAIKSWTAIYIYIAVTYILLDHWPFSFIELTKVNKPWNAFFWWGGGGGGGGGAQTSYMIFSLFFFSEHVFDTRDCYAFLEGKKTKKGIKKC